MTAEVKKCSMKTCRTIVRGYDGMMNGIEKEKLKIIQKGYLIYHVDVVIMMMSDRRQLSEASTGVVGSVDDKMGIGGE